MVYEKVLVLENERLGTNEGRLWVHAQTLAKIAHPGQFAMLSQDTNETFLPRAISINRVAGEAVAFAYQEKGSGTKAFSRLVSGDILKYLGPLGNGFDLSITGKNVLLVGGGIGRAPLEWLAESLAMRGNDVTLLFGARTKEGLGGLLDISHFSNISFRLVTDDGSLGKKGFVIDYMQDIDNFDRIYACGPTPMMQAVKSLAEVHNKPLQISLEGKMACGMGVCLGCTCNSKETSSYPKVCKDGPVFWKEMVELSW